MIISDKGRVRFEGSVVEIRADLTTAIHELHGVFTERFGAEKSNELIMEAVEMAFTPEEEIDAKCEEIQKTMEQKAQKVTDALMKILLGGM